MICNRCGADNQAGTRFCVNCGAELAEPSQTEQQATYQQPNYQQQYQQQNYQQPMYQQPMYQQPMYQPMQTPADPGRGFAIASLVLGIVSFFCFPAVTGILGIIFGGVARSKGSKSPMAIAGIICGVIGIILWIVLLILSYAIGLDIYQFAG
ncbi:MAG: DUF4190 domain-containing protein [Acutalibacteraceae bacterium]|nr:DUF4190 domain-containing protein [Acutalibacteraceae bacterium]